MPGTAGASAAGESLHEAGKLTTFPMPEVTTSGGVRSASCVALLVLLAGCGADTPSAPSGAAAPGQRPASGQVADVIVVGDIGMCGSAGVTATAELVAGLSGRLLLAGDIAYPNGSARDFEQCFNPAWGRFRSRWHAVPGNHEYVTPGAGGYFDYFGDAAGPDRNGYYSLVIGDWLVLMLDSNIPTARGTPQWEFVNRALEIERRPCTLAVWHHPLFSSGQNGPNPFMRDLFARLEEGGADVVVSGHDHLYERFAKQSADGRAADRGVRQFIVGVGGAELYRFVTATPNSEARLTQFGALRLTLQPAGYRWEFVLTSGGLGDSGSDTCQ